MAEKTRIPLIAHVIFRLDVGGLENGLVNLINNFPEDKYRHAIICLKDATEFRQRISAKNVDIIAMNKKDGTDIGIYFRLWQTFRRMRPDIVHTRNLPTIDIAIPAFFAGVAVRIHGEHGWDVFDLHGNNRKYRLIRRVCRWFVSRYITVSEHLAGWLRESIGVSADRITHICNGVDTKRFRPGDGKRRTFGDFAGPGTFVIGAVGRMAQVKNPVLLAESFVQLVQDLPDAHERLRLVMIGDGEKKTEVEHCLRDGNAAGLALLPGRSNSIPDLMREFDLFVLPSLNEGISNTILEAMASGLPVVATDVGGNAELVVDGSTGFLVPSADKRAMTAALRRYVTQPDLAVTHGREGRQRAERNFSLSVMVNRYMRVYDSLLGSAKDQQLAGQN